MQQPVIAAKASIKVELKPGVYSWCQCGRSASQPFCDGSHRGTGFEPLQFEITENRVASLCQCKRTSNRPYCDGTHKSLIDKP